MADIKVIQNSGTEREIAAEQAATLRGELSKVCGVMDEIKRSGFVATFQLGMDAFGRNVVQNLSIVKPLA